MRVVFDTNVLLSALLFKGAVAKLLPLIEARKVVPCFIPSTVREFRAVLSREKFRVLMEELGLRPDELVEVLLGYSALFPEPVIEHVIRTDPADNAFLACARVADAAFLVSGDRHLRALGSYRGIPIVSPREFLTSVTSVPT